VKPTYLESLKKIKYKKNNQFILEKISEIPILTALPPTINFNNELYQLVAKQNVYIMILW